jgi:hypothetical protein
MQTAKQIEERIDKLWIKYLDLVKSGKINDQHIGMISFARFVVHEIINEQSVKSEAWDKARQFIQETGNFQVTDIMDSTLTAVEKDRVDDKLRKAGD